MDDIGFLLDGKSEKVCELCNGEGVRIVASKEPMPCKQPGRFEESLMAIPCLCRLNQRIEDRFPCLRGPAVTELMIGGTLKNWDPGKNYVFNGNEDRFVKIVKAMFVHLSQIPHLRMLISDGTDLIKEYYISNEENTEKSLAFLKRTCHFLVIKFESHATNKALQPVIVDVVQARLTNRLTTWIWSEGDITSYQEWSGELRPILFESGKFTVKSLVTAKASNGLQDSNALINAGGL